MIQTSINFRVRYADTDKMGVVYYGNYATFYEMGRTEMFRELGLSYLALEEHGVMMPVVELHSNFKKSAKYDDLLKIVTKVEKLPDVRIRFDYEIYNEQGELLNTGYTVLVFVDMQKLRPIRMPEIFAKACEKYF